MGSGSCCEDVSGGMHGCVRALVSERLCGFFFGGEGGSEDICFTSNQWKTEMFQKDGT